MISGSLSSLHLPHGRRGSRFLGSGSRAPIFRAITALLMSPAEPGITQADIDSTIRMNGQTFNLMTVPISPCHSQRTRGDPVGPSARVNTGSECEAQPSIP